MCRNDLLLFFFFFYHFGVVSHYTDYIKMHTQNPVELKSSHAIGKNKRDDSACKIINRKKGCGEKREAAYILSKIK